METRRAFQTSLRQMSIILSGHEERNYLKFIGLVEILAESNREVRFLYESQCGESRSRGIVWNNGRELTVASASSVHHPSIYKVYLPIFYIFSFCGKKKRGKRDICNYTYIYSRSQQIMERCDTQYFSFYKKSDIFEVLPFQGKYFRFLVFFL